MTEEIINLEALNRRNYQVLQMLGQSALARVYLLREGGAFGLMVAKEILPTGIKEADEEFYRLFLLETRRLKELSHPGLPRIIDAFVENGLCYLVREYAEGNTPGGILQASKKPLQEKQIFQWILSLCDIFIYLHGQEQPVLFGGLRPDNIFVSAMGKIKIIDYGLARFLPDALQKRYFTSMAPGYTSPELRRGQPMDGRSDIYSLGMLAYHLLTGVKADTSLPKEDILRSKRPALPEQAVKAVMRAVELKLESRFPRMEEFKEEIVAAMKLRMEPIIGIDKELHEHYQLTRGGQNQGAFGVRNEGTGNMSVILESDQPWLKVSPEVNFGNAFRAHFTISYERFESGKIYEGHIRIFSENPRMEKTVTVKASKKAGLMDAFRKPPPRDVDF